MIEIGHVWWYGSGSIVVACLPCGGGVEEGRRRRLSRLRSSRKRKVVVGRRLVIPRAVGCLALPLLSRLGFH